MHWIRLQKGFLNKKSYQHVSANSEFPMLVSNNQNKLKFSTCSHFPQVLFYQFNDHTSSPIKSVFPASYLVLSFLWHFSFLIMLSSACNSVFRNTAHRFWKCMARAITELKFSFISIFCPNFRSKALQNLTIISDHIFLFVYLT